MICNICQVEKDEEKDFYRQKGGPMCRCKECHKEYVRKWYVLNRHKIDETRKKYHNSKYRTKKMAEAFANESANGQPKTAG